MLNLHSFPTTFWLFTGWAPPSHGNGDYATTIFAANGGTLLATRIAPLLPYPWIQVIDRLLFLCLVPPKIALGLQPHAVREILPSVAGPLYAPAENSARLLLHFFLDIFLGPFFPSSRYPSVATILLHKPGHQSNVQRRALFSVPESPLR